MSWTSWGEHGISVIREYEIPGGGGQGIVKQHFGIHALSLCTKGMGKGGVGVVAPGAGPGPPPVAALVAGPPPVAAVAAVAKAAAVAVGKEGDFKRRKK